MMRDVKNRDIEGFHRRLWGPRAATDPTDHILVSLIRSVTGFATDATAADLISIQVSEDFLREARNNR
jgi:hypothetical protein